jgi:glyoxylase-like metal-dependent hydrolase (beta-lactamase superfamily II)
MNIRHITSTVCFSLLAACSGGQDNGGQPPAVTTASDTATQPAANAKAVTGYSAREVAGNVWVIHGPKELPNPANKGFMNNPGFIVAPQGVVVIDPGSSVYTGRMLLDEIAKVTDAPVVAVFNTHVHGDHWLGNDAIASAFPDAVIYGHPMMIDMIDAGAGDLWLDTMHNMTEGATDGTRIVKPQQSTDGGDRLSVAGAHFDILHLGKAHTGTDIMIFYREGKVLFTGDNAGNGRILRLDHGSFPGNVETLQAGIELAPEVVVPGHGETGGIEVLGAYRDYLDTLYTMVKQGYEDGISDFEMKDDVHAALSAYHDWSGYDDELGKHISEAWLEAEAAAF